MARKRYIDDIVTEAAAGSVEAVVNLGAGYDSRAYRFKDTMPKARFFEIDLPAMSAVGLAVAEVRVREPGLRGVFFRLAGRELDE